MSIAQNSMLFCSLLRAPCSLLHDWIMRLSEEMEESFWAEIRQYEEDKKMEYVTSVERIGIKKGIQQGIQQGVEQGMQRGILQKAREAVIENLEVRFEVVPASIVKTINEMDDPSVLKMLHKKAATVDSLQEFKGVMERVMS